MKKIIHCVRKMWVARIPHKADSDQSTAQRSHPIYPVVRPVTGHYRWPKGPGWIHTCSWYSTPVWHARQNQSNQSFSKLNKMTPNTAYQHTLVLGINISFCRYYSKAPGVFVSCQISCDFLFVWLPCSSKAPQSPLWNKCGDLWVNICL